ncbi:MAG: adenine phosphoribosyltransferase [Myxococcota bacterium]
MTVNRLERVVRRIREVPDFPKPGILFKDITPMLADSDAFRTCLDLMAEMVADEQVDAIVGLESRGFIFGSALAARMGCGFVPVRKPGKLPGQVDSITYQLEYGEDSLEIHRDALQEGTRVLVVDDLIATGGTARAAGELVTKQGADIVGFSFVVELAFLEGVTKLVPHRVFSLIRY